MSLIRSRLPASRPGVLAIFLAAQTNISRPFLALLGRSFSIQQAHHARAVHWLLAGVLALATAPAALAGPGNFLVDKEAFFNQTSGSQPTAASRWQFGTQIYQPAENISGATITVPGGSPISMNGSSGFLFPSPSLTTFFTSQSQFNAALPDGNYTFGVTINSSGGTASLTMPDNSFYPATVPFLSPSSFSALEHYNPGQSLNLAWNSFVPDARTTSPLVSFFIQDRSNFAEAFSTSSSTNVSSFTSATIPAGTLQPNHSYLATLVFTNNIMTTNAYFSTYDTDIMKEYYTDINFTTTAVPEPSSLALLGAGIAALLACCMPSRGGRGTRQTS